MSSPSSKSGSAPCGLYLILPENWTDPDFLRSLRDLFRAINSSAYEKNNHVIELRGVEGEPDAEKIEMIRAFAELARSQGVIFLTGANIALSKAANADGVMLTDLADMESARALLGDDAIIGLRCGISRHSADRALQNGADFVSFSDPASGFVNPSLVQWWHYKTDNPCLVEGSLTNDHCDFYVKAGVDFIEASDYVWQHPKGVMQGIVNMIHAIDLAADGEEKEAVS